MNARTPNLIPAALLVLGLGAAPAAAVVEVIPLAQFGDPSPDGDGFFGSFLDYGPPCLNDSSHVLFSADLYGNSGGTLSDELLVRAKPGGPRVILARESAWIPGSLGRYDNLRTPNRRYVLNNEGRAAFDCDLTETPGGTTDNQAILSTDGPGTETLHVRKGDLAPGTTGTFTGLVSPTINNEMPCIVAFYAWAAGSGAHPGTIYTNRAGTSTLVAKITDIVPGAAGTLWQFDEGEPPSIEPDGDWVAFRAQLTGTPFASQDDAAVYKGRGAGLVQVARGRDPVPGAGVNLDEPYFPTQNVMGNVAFRSVLYPTSAGDVIEIAGGDLTPDVVVISSQLHPDQVSQFDHFDNPALSAGNVSAFRATLKNTPGGGLDDSGIYRGDGTVLIEVAREGQTVPEGGGEFASFGSNVAINVNAQVLFIATLRNTPLGTSDNEGLYLWDELTGLTKLVRRHDTVPSSGGVVIDILALSATDYGGFRSLNDAGEAVAILDMDGLFAKDGVYLFRGAMTDDVVATLPAARLRLIASPNPWKEGDLMLRLSAPDAGALAERAAGTGLPAAARELEIYASDGRRIRTMTMSAGASTWNGTDDRGIPVPGGVYFARSPLGEIDGTTKIVRLAR